MRTRLQVVLATMVVGSLFLPTGNLAAEPDAKAIEAIQQDVQLLRESVYRPLSKSEVERAIKLLHPDMVEQVGGPLKARANADSEARRSVQSLFKIEQVEFHEKPRFVTGTKHEFVMVPIKLTLLRADGIRDVSQWFYLGGRPKGSKAWVYVDVPRLAEKGPTAFFADFPSDTELPAVSRKQIRPDR